MKKFNVKTILTSVAALALAFLFATQVSAMTPNLTLTSNGSGSVQVSVYADANASVILDYYSGSQLMGAGVIGYTNYSGYFSGTLNTYQYSMIPNGAQVVVIVNNQQSPAIVWPANGYNNGNSCYQVYPYNCNNNNGYNSGQISLSQSNVSLAVGQSQSISIYNTYNTGNYPTYNNQYYVSNNSNGTVSATISGNILTLYGQNTGSANISVCSNTTGGYNTGCATLYVTVTGYNNNNNYCYQTYPYNCNNNNYNNNTCGYYPYTNCNNNNYYSTPLSVSNNNVQVTVGNTGVVAIYGNNSYAYPYTNGYAGYNSYYVTTGNNGIATATISGSTLTIYGTNPGTTSVTVCSTSGNQCATVYVTVNAPQYVYNGPYNYPSQPGNWAYSNKKHCWYRQ